MAVSLLDLVVFSNLGSGLWAQTHFTYVGNRDRGMPRLPRLATLRSLRDLFALVLEMQGKVKQCLIDRLVSLTLSFPPSYPPYSSTKGCSHRDLTLQMGWVIVVKRLNDMSSLQSWKANRKGSIMHAHCWFADAEKIIWRKWKKWIKGEARGEALRLVCITRWLKSMSTSHLHPRFTFGIGQERAGEVVAHFLPSLSQPMFPPRGDTKAMIDTL